MRSGILTENAELAWRAALVYRNILLDGRDTIQNKKNFVSSFHNAVELFCKQKMIFDNNHSVIIITNKDPDAQLAKRFYNSVDLNMFFSELRKEEFDSIRSCDYKDLKLKEIFNASTTLSNIEQRGGMKLLEKLRNEETHFAFNDSFLTCGEFEILDNFLMDFYVVLQENDLLLKHFGRRSHIDSEKNRLIPSRGKVEHGFNFKKQLKKSKFVDLFKKVILENEFFTNTPDLFSVASDVYDQVSTLSNAYSFDEVFEYIVCLKKYRLIDIRIDHEKVVDEYEENYADIPIMKISWKE